MSNTELNVEDDARYITSYLSLPSLFNSEDYPGQDFVVSALISLWTASGNIVNALREAHEAARQEAARRQASTTQERT